MGVCPEWDVGISHRFGEEAEDTHGMRFDKEESPPQTRGAATPCRVLQGYAWCCVIMQGEWICRITPPNRVYYMA